MHATFARVQNKSAKCWQQFCTFSSLIYSCIKLLNGACVHLRGSMQEEGPVQYCPPANTWSTTECTILTSLHERQTKHGSAKVTGTPTQSACVCCCSSWTRGDTRAELPTCDSIQSKRLLMYSGADSRVGFLTFTPSAQRYSYCNAQKAELLVLQM